MHRRALCKSFVSKLLLHIGHKRFWGQSASLAEAQSVPGAITYLLHSVSAPLRARHISSRVGPISKYPLKRPALVRVLIKLLLMIRAFLCRAALARSSRHKWNLRTGETPSAMTPFALVGLTVGIILGSRFTVHAVVPAMIYALAIGVGGALVRRDLYVAAMIELSILLALLQAGYLLGATASVPRR